MNRKWTIWAIIAGAVVVGTGTFLGRVVWVADDAERQLQAVTYVYVACEGFIRVRRDWPRSWDDLEQVTPRRGGVELPRDLDWVRRRVNVNFHAKLGDIARETPDAFDGFGPSGRAYYDYTRGYEEVIDAAKGPDATRPGSPPAAQ